MAGTAGTEIFPSTTDRRYNRRAIASRSVDESNEPGGASFTRLFYMTVVTSHHRWQGSFPTKVARPKDLVFTRRVFSSQIAAATRTAALNAFVGLAGVFLVAACSSSETASPPSSSPSSTPSSVTPSGALGNLSITPTPTASPAAAVPGVYGDPAAVAKYWRAQSLEDNCGLMSVADIVGEITGQQPTEEQMLTLAENTPSVVNAGTPIYAPRNDPSHTNGNGGVSMGDLVALFDHYGIKSTMSDDDHPDQTGMPAVQGYLGAGRKVIAYVNSAVVWNTSDQRTKADHFLVVTGVDTNKDIVHLNDPGADHADEQVPTAAFTTAWQTSGDSIVFTAPPG